MTITFTDRVVANPIMQAIFVLGFIAAIWAYATDDGPFLLIILAALPVLRSQAALKRIRENEDWERTKAPARLRQPEVAAPRQPRRGFFKVLALALGHPLVSWSLMISGTLLLWGWYLSGQHEPIHFATGGAIMLIMLLAVLCYRYWRKSGKAAAQPALPQVPLGYLAADDANPVRGIVPALTTTPSVKQAMQALPPALYQLVFDGLKIEAAKRTN